MSVDPYFETLKDKIKISQTIKSINYNYACVLYLDFDGAIVYLIKCFQIIWYNINTCVSPADSSNFCTVWRVNSYIYFLFTYCKVVGCASGVGLPPVALSPSFLDKGVGTGPVST